MTSLSLWQSILENPSYYCCLIRYWRAFNCKIKDIILCSICGSIIKKGEAKDPFLPKNFYMCMWRVFCSEDGDKSSGCPQNHFRCHTAIIQSIVI